MEGSGPFRGSVCIGNAGGVRSSLGRSVCLRPLGRQRCSPGPCALLPGFGLLLHAFRQRLCRYGRSGRLLPCRLAYLHCGGCLLVWQLGGIGHQRHDVCGVRHRVPFGALLPVLAGFLGRQACRCCCMRCHCCCCVCGLPLGLFNLGAAAVQPAFLCACSWCLGVVRLRS